MGARPRTPLKGIARWAQGSPTWDASGGLAPDAAVLAMKTMSTRPAAQGASASLHLKLFDSRCPRPPEYSYAVDLDDASLVAIRDLQTHEDVDFSCASTQWTRHLFDTPAGIASAEATFPDRVAAFNDAYRATLDPGSTRAKRRTPVNPTRSMNISGQYT